MSYNQKKRYFPLLLFFLFMAFMSSRSFVGLAFEDTQELSLDDAASEEVMESDVLDQVEAKRGQIHDTLQIVSDSTHVAGASQEIDALAAIQEASGYTNQISGLVMGNAPGENLLSDIQVFLYHPSDMGGWTLLDTTETELGTYSFSDLESGRYRLCFYDPDTTFVFECYDDAPTLDSATDLVLNNNIYSDVNAYLSNGGGISGRVERSNNQPLAGVGVLAFNTDGDLIQDTITNNRGEYFLTALNPDTYIIQFMPEAPDLAPEYFLDTPHFVQAMPIPVPEGTIVGGINATLEERSASISGTIIRHYGTQAPSRSPLLEPFIHIYQDVNGIWYHRTDVSVTIMSSGANFLYNISGLAPSPVNRYKLAVEDLDAEFVSEYYNEQYTFLSADTIPPNTNNIFITLERNSGSIEGSVTVDGPSPTPADGVRVHLLRYEIDTNSWERLGPLYNDETEVIDGNYMIEGLPPGNYRVFFYHPSNPFSYPARYYNNTTGDFRGSKFENAETVIIPQAGGSVQHVNLIYRRHQAPPVAKIDHTISGVNFDPDTGLLLINKHGPSGGNLGLETEIACPDDLVPYDVTFILSYDGNPLFTYPMAEILPHGSGIYRVVVPQGDLDQIYTRVGEMHQMHIDWLCPGSAPGATPAPPTSHSKPIGSIRLYDPSGYITDLDTGQGIPNAIVALYHVEGWLPKEWPGDDRPRTCQSHNSKEPTDPWDQPAPTSEGQFTNPDLGLISPSINPQYSDGEGYYNWNVARGCWYIVIEAAGYESKTSPVVGIPPEVTDLNQELMPLPPIADFLVESQSGTAPLTLLFTDISTHTVSSRLWDFGDGTTSDEEFPEHTYRQAGVYSVSLTVSNSNGEDTITKTDLITVDAAANPVVMSLSPPTITVAAGQPFELPIVVDTYTQTFNQASIHLNFDPSILSVITMTGSQHLENIQQNQFDNQGGEIDFVATTSSTRQGSFTLATVTLMAITTTQGSLIDFNLTEPRQSDLTLHGLPILNDAVGSVVIADGDFNDSLSLNGSVTLQGRPPKADVRWQVPLRVSLTRDGEDTPAYSFTPTTDVNGHFMLTGIQAGIYEVRVKNNHTLENMLSVTFVTGTNTIDFGTLREGDANDDNFVTILDFSILAATFGMCEGTNGYDERADFNGDTCVTILDFSLLASNFGQGGTHQPVVEPQSTTQPGEETVTLNVEPAQSLVRTGDVFTATLLAQTGEQKVDGVQLMLNFDPNLLEIVAVNGSELLRLGLQNEFNNQQGTLAFAAGTLENFPNGQIELAHIQLRALAPSESTLLTFAEGTEVTFGGESVLRTQLAGRVIINVPTSVTIQKMTISPRISPFWFLIPLAVTFLVALWMAYTRQR